MGTSITWETRDKYTLMVPSTLEEPSPTPLPDCVDPHLPFRVLNVLVI